MSLQGTLKTLGITEVLEFLSDRSVTGRLDVTTEMGTAYYGFAEGAVVEAEYGFMRESGSDAAEATYYVLSELDGTFYFDDDRLPEPQDSGEDVGRVLARTVDIAEKWTDIEQIIPSPNHLLIRNDELDGSVTIQPEWWKALQMIGDGSTSLQLAALLNLGALDASLTAFAMAKAGLLVVREVDPLEIELKIDPTVEEPAPAEPVAIDGLSAQSQAVEQSRLSEQSGFSFHEADALTSNVESDAFEYGVAETAPDVPSTPGSLFQPVDMLEMVDVQAPSPAFDAPDENPAPQPVMSLPDQPVGVEPAPVDDFAGVSGMDDLSELEYVLEPDGHTSAGLTPGSPLPHTVAAGSFPDPVPVVDDDDGWSSGHDTFVEPLQPMTAATEQRLAEAPAPVQPPDETSPASPFDVIGVPVNTSPFGSSTAPVPDAVGAMDLGDLPAPPPPTATSSQHQAAPVPDTMSTPGDPRSHDVPTSATAMAGEVLDDLASMTNELESRAADPENWELDGTFVPKDSPPPASVDADPFGDLGQLLDESDNERGSVLKFLRRD